MKISENERGFCLIPEEGDGYTGYCISESGEGYFVRPVSHEDRDNMSHHYCCQNCGGVFPHPTQGEGDYLLFTDEEQRRRYEEKEEEEKWKNISESPFWEPTVMILEKEFREIFGIPEEVILFTMIPVKRI